MAMYGIYCSDRIARTSSFDEFQSVVDRLHDTSKVMGEMPVFLHSACAQWKLDAKERYEGDFHVTTKNPILILGNTHDGHTPIELAYNVSSGFDGSVVLEINGYGHESVSLPSMCTLETVSSYWLTGILPEPNTVCEVDAPPFSGKTWADVFKDATGKKSASKRGYIPWVAWA